MENSNKMNNGILYWKRRMFYSTLFFRGHMEKDEIVLCLDVPVKVPFQVPRGFSVEQYNVLIAAAKPIVVRGLNALCDEDGLHFEEKDLQHDDKAYLLVDGQIIFRFYIKTFRESAIQYFWMRQSARTFLV